jgi:hypothetical protein
VSLVVSESSTAALREQLRAARDPDPELFDFGDASRVDRLAAMPSQV